MTDPTAAPQHSSPSTAAGVSAAPPLAITCRDVVCRFGNAEALRGISLTLAAGDWAWVAGPSGSGKTTLLRAIAGLEPLADGTIHLGPALASNHRRHLAPHERGLGLLFQEASLWPQMSALDNVMLALADRPRARRAEEARHWLERLGVGELAARRPGELSGGEARRVALARTLAARPSLLLLDEPTAHLDLHLREDMMIQLRGLHAELGLTTLCVSHQLEPPLEPAERLLVLEAGRVMFDGPLSAMAAAVPTPYIAALRRSLTRMGLS